MKNLFIFIKKNKIFIFVSFITFLFVFVSLFFFKPNFDTVYPKVFIVQEGETVRLVANRLKEENLINSSTLFMVSAKLFGDRILAGSYHFLETKSVFYRTYQLARGKRNSEIVRITVNKGDNVYQIADKIYDNFKNFDKDKFIEESLMYQGYLYPNTYFFSKDENPTPELVIDIMRETFNKTIAGVFDNYEGKYTREEIIKIASIVELEAYKPKDQEKITSVIMNRLDENIPLQVDVSFYLINGKNSYTLTREDLKEENPFNSYLNTGLPPYPIGNPSRNTIEIVLKAPKTDYFYFLSDRKGNTYFSKTFQEHLLYKTKFLQ